jgi:hypothetical protein
MATSMEHVLQLDVGESFDIIWLTGSMPNELLKANICKFQSPCEPNRGKILVATALAHVITFLSTSKFY